MSADTRYPLRLRLLERFQLGELQGRLFAAMVIGVLGAVSTMLYRDMLVVTEHLLYSMPGGIMSEVAAHLPYWLRIVTPAVGGLLAGTILYLAGRWLTDQRSSDYMEAVSIGNGVLPLRLSLLLSLSSACTTVSGGSIGREGSMVQLAALMGSTLGRIRRVATVDLRLWVAYGAAAGVAAAYHAPIAGALFVSEIMLRTLSFERFWPLLVASVTADFVMHSIFGFSPVYSMPNNFAPVAGWNFMPFIGLGLVAGVLAPSFLLLLAWAKRCFTRYVAFVPLRLSLGGLAVGLISCGSPGVWGNGYSLVNNILGTPWLSSALLLILIGKGLATACTTGSGGVGGVFTPTIFMGAAVGALYGNILHAWGLTAVPVSAYTVVGMGAFLAASTHAPLMAILMLFEMTENYHTLMPLSVACVLGFYLARALRAESMYSHSLPGALPEFASQTVRDILRLDPPRVLNNARAADFEATFLQSRWLHVYVVNSAARFVGALSLYEFSKWLRGVAHDDAAVSPPAALIETDYPRVTLDMHLGEVLERFTRYAGERLPVVDAGGQLAGFVAKSDVMLLLQARTEI